MEIINKIKNGDVFYIPIGNGKFGVGQVLKLDNPKKPTEGMMVLLDALFEIDDIKNFSIEDLSMYKILSLTNLHLVMLKIKRWIIFGNYPLKTTEIPLWASQDIGAENEEKNGILCDFGNNFVRHLPYEQVAHMRAWFVRGPVYFENVLKRRFIDPTFLPENADESYYFAEWPEGTITEQDMMLNSHEYYTTGADKKPMLDVLKDS